MTQPSPSAKPPPQTRAHLRKTLLDQRRNTLATQRQSWDERIAAKLMDWCRQQKPISLGVFWPIQAEPDLLNCYPKLQELGIQLALPWVQKKAQALTFLLWTPGDSMSTDEYGIPVPTQREHIIQPASLLIPCVGFNANNYRLGYGGGYYDRTLSIAPRPQAIGIAYHQGLADFVAQTHDIPMDLIITEKYTRRVDATTRP
jgi:5-formyltetrahydrofolate cyclo-ligase